MNGFEIAGIGRVWDLTQPFSYFEVFSGMAVVGLIVGCSFLLMRYFKP